MNRSGITITANDRRRLTDLLERTGRISLVGRGYLEDLECELERATIVTPEEIPADVVTMNSKVLLRDLDTEEESAYTLVYPRDADAQEQRISVLAPVGTAMLGYRVGDVIEWPVPAGQVRLKVEALLYQPERAGSLDD